MEYPGWVGWSDPTRTVQNIAIHKNGTSFVESHAKQMGWTETTITTSKDIIRFVILRDPWERYLTAYVEDIHDVIYYKPSLKEKVLDSFRSDSLLIDVLIEMNVFKIGEHTRLQHTWINPLPDENTFFFRMNSNVGIDLHNWLNSLGIANTFNNSKIYERNKSDCVIYTRLLEFFENNSKSKEKVLKYLEPDYKLINTNKFYNE
jgi:hypothetical protein